MTHPEHHRRSIRLKGYDYTSPGGYFITLATWQRECLFGEVVGGEMRLNESGQICRDEWIRSAQIRREIELDEFVVMPNHFHAIVFIREMDDVPGLVVGATGRSPLPTPGENTRSTDDRWPLPTPGENTRSTDDRWPLPTHGEFTRSTDDRSPLPTPGEFTRPTDERSPLPIPGEFTRPTDERSPLPDPAAPQQDQTNPRGPKPASIGALVAGYKSACTTRINQIRQTPGCSVWQRNYYERIIRNERELDAVRLYIRDNPRRWGEDEENPER